MDRSTATQRHVDHGSAPRTQVRLTLDASVSRNQPRGAASWQLPLASASCMVLIRPGTLYICSSTCRSGFLARAKDREAEDREGDQDIPSVVHYGAHQARHLVDLLHHLQQRFSGKREGREGRQRAERVIRACTRSRRSPAQCCC